MLNAAHREKLKMMGRFDLSKRTRIRRRRQNRFEVEPLPGDSPLWDLPNVVMTPHVTPAIPLRTARSLNIICENIRRFRAGKPLRNRLTTEDVHVRPSGQA
jgi:phosphoglycerate dehydrogenase-like enzyme